MKKYCLVALAFLMLMGASRPAVASQQGMDLVGQPSSENLPDRVKHAVAIIDQAALWVIKQYFGGAAPANMAQQRFFYDKLVQKMSAPPPPIGGIQNVAIPVRGGPTAGSNNPATIPPGVIPGRLYTPTSVADDSIIVYFHGGAWVLGSLDSHDVVVRAIANSTGRKVLSVAYRLGPEFYFPTGVYDAYDAVIWVGQNAPAMGVNGAKIMLAGDSAGGNIAAAVAQLIRIKRESGVKEVEMPIFLALFYPATDLSNLDSPSWVNFSDGPVIKRSGVEFLVSNGWYTNQETRHNQYASPFTAGDLQDLMPTYIVLAKYDPLHDDGADLAIRIKYAGNIVYTGKFPRVHGFLQLNSEAFQVTGDAQDAQDAINGFAAAISSAGL